MPENSIGWVSVSYLRKGRILIMRRDKRHLGRENDSAKRVLYILGGALALTVIAFVAIFLLYGGDNSSTQIAKYNTSAIQRKETIYRKVKELSVRIRPLMVYCS